MHIVRVGVRFYNLEYLIVAEPAGEAGGELVVMMESGKEYRLGGAEAEEFAQRLGEALAPRRGPPPPQSPPSSPGAGGVDVDPATGKPLGRPPGHQRKLPGGPG